MKAIYFAKEMRLSQGYNNGNHKRHVPNDYPIDETYNKPNGVFYAPFDCVVVKKYKSRSNQIWITSVEPVYTPTFTDYVTILIGHISPKEFDKIKVGDLYKQKSPIVHEYKDGLSTGPHNHVTMGRGKLGKAWSEHNGVWCINTTGGAKKPEDCLYIDPDFTKIIDNKGIMFEFLDSPQEHSRYYTCIYDMYINKDMSFNNHQKVKNCTPQMKRALKYKEPNADAVIRKGTTITALDIIDKGDIMWIKNYNGYVCLKGKKGYYLTEYK